MATGLTERQKAAIQEQGYGLTGYIGGIKRTRYWTPDGREIFAIPQMREYVRKDANGKLIDGGIRDANLDNGWLLQPPQNPKLRCVHCDKWHDTEEEIEDCRKRKEAFDNRWLKKAKKEVVKVDEDERIGKLESEMSEIKDMLKQLLKRVE